MVCFSRGKCEKTGRLPRALLLLWRLLHLLQDAVEGTSVVASPPNSKSARPEDKRMVTVSRVAWLGGGFWLCSV